MNKLMTCNAQDAATVDDATLWDFMHGDLDPADALLIATHVCLSPTAASQVNTFNNCGAKAFEQIEPVAMKCCPIKFFEDRCKGKKDAVVDAPADKAHDLPKPLRTFIGQDIDSLVWTEMLPGVYQSLLNVPDSKAEVKLVRAAKGTLVPEHMHHGDETALVLKGSFIDRGRRYRRGDVHVTRCCRVHAPIVTEDCLCLIIGTKESSPVIVPKTSFWQKCKQFFKPCR